MLDILIPTVLLALLVLGLRILPRKVGKSSHHKLSLRHPTGDPGWTFEHSHKSLSIHTSALNALPRQIISKCPPVISRWYDLGTIAGGIGGGVGIAGSLWALGSVWRAVWDEAKLHAMEQVVEAGVVQALSRRAMEYVGTGAPDTPSSSGGLQPLIPGVTVPLSHLPTLVLAVVLNQMLHELGHAFAAALDDLSPSRLSFNLHLLIPSMMVSFPSTVDTLPSLAASGPWHNLTTYTFIILLSFGGFGGLFWSDISPHGRVIESVNPLSPLFGHLLPGMLVTHLDDVFLGGQRDVWSEYLTGNEVGDAGRGWCIEKSMYEALPSPPCLSSDVIAFHHTKPTPSSERCLAPHPMLDTPSGRCPCPGNKWVCVRPIPEEQVLRIQTEAGFKNREHVVLWSGERTAVLADVVLGIKGPRFLGSVTRWATLFLDYLSTIALSLYLFNLIPLPGTDGSQYLKALLSLRRTTHSSPNPSQKPFQATLISPSKPSARPAKTLFEADEISDEELAYDDDDDKTWRKEDRWKGRLRKSIEAGMVAVIAGWVAGWAMLALLRSS